MTLRSYPDGKQLRMREMKPFLTGSPDNARLRIMLLIRRTG
jgi:hypothetical protein